MTILKYILETGAATSGDIMQLKRVDPSGYDTLVKWAREQAAANGVAIETTVAK